MTRDGEIKQRQHLCQHGDTLCYLESGYVTTKLHGTSTCRCNNNAMFSDIKLYIYIFKFPAVYVCWPQQSLGNSCQTGKMAGLINSLCFVFKISFLPKYQVIYNDYIVKSRSGI